MLFSFASKSLDFFLANLETLYRMISVEGTFSDGVIPLFEKHSAKRFSLKVAYESDEHCEAIMSHRERCLELFMYDSPHNIILTYCEVLLRVLYNFFWSASKDFCGGKRVFFLDSCITFMKEFFTKATQLMYPQQFELMYLTYSPYVDYPLRYVRIINNNYIEYCK